MTVPPSSVSALFLLFSALPAASWSQQQLWTDYYSEQAKRFFDYHHECASRCDQHFARLSEWLTSSLGGIAGPLPAGRQAQSACPSAAQFPRPQIRVGNSSEGAKLGVPLVLPILHGNISDGSATDTLEMPSFSVTLVLDRDPDGTRRMVLVDSGLPTHRALVLAGLLAHGLSPSQVDTVLVTHPDAHSMGNLNLFPCAELHSGSAISRGGLFARQPAPIFVGTSETCRFSTIPLEEGNRSDLPFRPLTANADLLLTPGTSLQDQSLLVRNVRDHGTVAIVGKLILNEDDLAHSNSAIRLFGAEDSEHRKLWQATRREIVCLADYVIPGHGPPFRVSPALKKLAECAARTSPGGSGRRREWAQKWGTDGR